MAQIIGIGDPVNPGLASFFDGSFDFTGFGLTDHFEVKAASVVAADQGGVQRVFEVRPIETARSLLQTIVASQPQYIANGGPSGLTDALSFAKARPDGMTLGALPVGTMTKVLILRAALPDADNVNYHLLSTLNAGTGRNAWYMRRVSGGLTFQAFIGDSPANGAIANVAGVPADTWVAAIMSVDVATRTVSAGMRATGQTAWTWGTAVYPEAYPQTVTDHTLGARSAMTALDALEGRIAGALTFVGHDARTDAGLLDQINAWAFGPQSIFGL